jgi:hypothetical protein
LEIGTFYQYTVATPFTFLLDPPEHRITQILEVLVGEIQGPQEFDLLDQLFLHIVPTVLDGIEIRTNSRPVNHLKDFVRQKFLICLLA